MRFTVPQFIDYEAKIIGPLSFRQFIYIGTASGAIFVLYFSLAKINFLLFLSVSLLIFSAAVAFAFVKIGGRSLPVIFENVLRFSIAPKIYIWRKGEEKIRTFEKIEMKKEETEETPVPKIVGKSLLNKLNIQVETKTKR